MKKVVMDFQVINEFSSKIVNLARNAPKPMEINSKYSKYHSKSLSDEKGGDGFLGD